MKFQRITVLLLATISCTVAQGAPPVLEDFTRDPEIAGAQLSPDGKHIALRVITEGLATLQIRSVPDFKLTGTFGIAGRNEVGDFYWKNDERLLVGVRRRLGTLGKAEYTGSLIAVDMDGKKSTVISQQTRTSVGDVSGDIRDFIVVDPWHDDHDHILIQRYDGAKRAYVLQSCSVYVPTCKLLMLPRLPHGSFWTDANGEVRGQSGSRDDNKTLLMYRDPVTDDWKDFDSFYSGDGGMDPAVFDPKGKWVIAFDDRENPVTGVYKVDLETRQHQLLYRDPVYDATQVILGADRTVIGASWEGERQRWTFFDGAHPDVALYTALRKGLGNVSVDFVNFTRAGDRVLLVTESDVAPPTYYVVDLKAKSIIMRIPTRSWIDPAQMAPMTAISFQARDGLTIRGYLTLPPKQVAGSKAPLVVLPHGGPLGVRDLWAFDAEVQLLANHGYAVLQVNYRGSGGYGREFQNKGYGQWGRGMQDDITDGAKWAARRADIDGARMCIYGASYGAYAALMAVQRDPGLFRCAAGYVGVYDLEMMFNKGDVAQDLDGWNYLKQALGDDSAELKARSPVNFAAAVQVPVFLAHGKDDQRAPVQHFVAMRDALQKANKPVETLLKDNEGHGFYNAQNRLELYTKLLAFFDRNLGMAAASPQ